LDLEEGHVQSLLSLEELRTRDDGWTDKVDLSPLFLNLTLDVATEFLYGHSTNSQITHSAAAIRRTGSAPRDDFGFHLDGGKGWIYTKALFGRWHGLIRSSEFSRHCKELHRLVDGYVAETLERGTKPDTGSKKTLLDELSKETQDPLELRSETLNILNAGRDTTGALLGWVFYYLARNPQVYEKLRVIIIEEFGSNYTSEITFQKLRSCQYLSHCINEVLRIAAVVPLNERVCIRDTTLPRGGGPDGMQPIFIHKGLRVLIAKYAMQHRADIWGPDVEDFVPERWEGRKIGWEFMPFGGGPRKCIGQQFALTEASYVVVRFLQRFDKLENMEPPGPPKFQITVSSRSQTGTQVRLHQSTPA